MPEIQGASPKEKPNHSSEIHSDVSLDREALGTTFPVACATVAKELTAVRSEGFINFIIVDDYTDCCLRGRYLYDIAPSMGAQPNFRDDADKVPDELTPNLKALSTGNFMVFDIMHPMASDALYGKGGISNPTFEQLPAVYAITIGESEGRFILNAQKDRAEAFMKSVLELNAKTRGS